MTHAATAGRFPEPTLVAGLGWGLAMLAIAVVGRFATDTSSEWYLQLAEPAWQPPGSVFAPVWTSIYVLIVVSATLAYRDVGGRHRRLVLGRFAGNLALNLSWSLIVFQARAPLVAAFEIVALLVTILALIWLVRPYIRVAALALLPYAAWVTFATVLDWWTAVNDRGPAT